MPSPKSVKEEARLNESRGRRSRREGAAGDEMLGAAQSRGAVVSGS